MGRLIARGLGLLLAVLLIVAGFAIALLDTDAGRSFAVQRLAKFETASGLNIHVGRIEGSIYGRMVLRDLEVRDMRGAFLTSPAVTLDWRPFAYLHKVVDLRELSAAQMRLLRRPAFKAVPSDPNAPILPDIDVRVGKLEVARLLIDPPVTGQRHLVHIAGTANIADGRAQVNAGAQALQGPGISGGDGLALRLDAVPDADRLVIDTRLIAPAGGLVDSYAKLGKPIDLQIGGRGSWSNWAGTLFGTLGGRPFARLALAAQNGTFRVRGRTLPALLLPASAQYLVEKGLDVDLTAKLAERRSDTRLLLRSELFSASANGLLDFGTSRFGHFAVQAQVLKPAALAKNLSGNDVRFAATLDGPFARPTMDYRLIAARLGFGSMGVERLVASSKGTIDPNKLLIPLSLRAARVTGLNPALGGLLLNVAVDGDLAYANGRLLSDNLRIRSSRIDATAIVIADIPRGQYRGAIKGRVNDYQIDGLGRVDLTTDARLVSGAKGFGITGAFRVVTRHLDNAGVQNQFGGPAVVTGRFGYDANGMATVTSLRLVSPKLRILDGEGSYRPDGSIRFAGRAVSSQYGPVAVVVTGTTSRPVIHLKAANPNIGVQLRNVEADIVATAGGYQVRARGGSAYGPFTADVIVRTGGGPLTIDLTRVQFAGINFRGRVMQTAAGPFAGNLTLAGAGLNGTVRLAAAGRYQRADLDVRASNARIPGDTPITIGGGLIRASIIMYPGAPAIVGGANLTNVRQGLMVVSKLQGRIDYRGGRGRLGLVASGATPSPFDIALQAALSPDRVIANARGTFNRIPFRLASPAVATKVRGEWLLAPATLIVPQGQARVSGRYGRTTSLHADLSNLDIAIAEAFSPGLGLGGKASGSVDVAFGGPVPRIDTRQTIARFTRTAAYTISAPVDVAMLGSLSGAGGDLRALIRRGPTVVGRLQARLAPLGPGASLSQRLLGAPLSGGIRYNGPAEVLWTLTGVADQHLVGPIVVAADFGGRADRPTLVGIVRSTALRYDNQTYGTRITDIAMLGRFSQSRLDIVSLSGRAGRGTVTARGSIGLDAASGFPIDLTTQFDNAQLARSDALGATASGTLQITNGPTGGLIRGNLTIPEARYEIIRQGSAEVAELSGVRRKSDANQPQQQQAQRLATNRFKLDLTVRADNRIFTSGMGLEAEWETRMRITGTSANPTVVGRLELVRGTYSFAGRRFELAQDGAITFDGGAFNNPTISLRATTTVEGVTAVINISGRAQRPQIAFTSTPALAQDEVLSRLLFGSSVTALSPTQAIQLAAALNSLRGSGGGGLNPLGKLRSATGISRLRILGADKTAGRGTALAAGQYISNNIYIEVITDARGFTATQLEIALSRTLSILSQAGTFGSSNVNLRYSKNY